MALRYNRIKLQHMKIRLDEIWEKWSDQLYQLSIVRFCANLKNAIPILVTHPKDDMHRPFEFLLLFEYTEIRYKNVKV